MSCKILVLILLFAFLEPLCAYENNQLSLKSQSVISPQKKALEFISKNTGERPLYKLRVNLYGLNKKTLVRPVLMPGETNRVIFDISNLSQNIFSIITCFEDQFGRPFSAVSSCIKQKPENPFISISAIKEISEIELSEQVSFIISNSGEKRELEAKIILPNEFKSENSSKTFRIRGHSKKEIKFNIFNKYALTGANYPYHLILNEKGGNNTFISNAFLKVVEKENPVKKFRWYLMGLAVFFFLLIIFEIKTNE